jgi:hypothetical protein
MTLEDIRGYLRSVSQRPAEPTPEAVEQVLAVLKKETVARGDQNEAKAVWRLEQGLRAQNLYLQAFEAMKEGRFYQAWCDLEQAELALHFLEPHGAASWSECRLDFIREYIAKWQALFPYKIFMSPEILEIEKVCSICKHPVFPRKPCGHRVGEIYDGEMCARVVTKSVFLGMALVSKPVQKYSVPFLSNGTTGKTLDQYNYGVVQYAITALRNPFDAWDAVWTTRRQPHSTFRHVGRNDPCPCESGKKYKKCCLQETGVLRPHLKFRFAVAPPPNIPTEVYIS